MEEKNKEIKINEMSKPEKLLWEVPKLICLDKGKTEGGSYQRGTEDGSYFYS